MIPVHYVIFDEGMMTMKIVEPIRDKKKIDAMKRYLKGKNIRDYVLFVLGYGYIILVLWGIIELFIS